VIFTGARSEGAALLPELTAYVEPFPAEGLSDRLLEAMTVGLPVVATRGGSAEPFEDGEHGLLVSGGDPFALAWAIDRVLSDAELRSRLTRAARDRVKSLFRADRMVSATTALYESLLASPTSVGRELVARVRGLSLGPRGAR
jgi:glycosyltransferase involved in cell wall biosynthesis